MHKTLLMPVISVTLALTGCTSHNRGVGSYLPEPVMMPRKQPMALSPAVARTWHRGIGNQNPYPQETGLPRGVDLPGGIRRNWQYIVIHHSASDSGNAWEFDRFHRTVRGWNELGYHFVIGNGRGSTDGRIEVGPRWWKQKHGAHCKTPDNRFNDYGIGICLVGNFRDGNYPTAAQMRSLEKLVSHLSRTCNISLSNIYSHGSITHKTECPGPNLSLEQLKMRLSGVAYR